MTVCKAVFGFVVMMCIAWTPAHANLLTNGSFEDGPVIAELDGFVELPIGSTAITGWTVIEGEIDIVGTTFWQHADGIRSLDLDGTPGSGGVSQSVVTEIGVDYLVTFDLAASPGGTEPERNMRVAAADQSQDFLVDATGRTLSDMGWEMRSWVFTANSTLTTLELFSLNPQDGFFGPALDNVSVVVVPEPVSSALWSLVGMAILARKRRH